MIGVDGLDVLSHRGMPLSYYLWVARAARRNRGIASKVHMHKRKSVDLTRNIPGIIGKFPAKDGRTVNIAGHHLSGIIQKCVQDRLVGVKLVMKTINAKLSYVNIHTAYGLVLRSKKAEVNVETDHNR